MTKLKAVAIDQVGLFLGLTLLALVGVQWPFFICMAVGFITADLIQHSVFTLGRRKYTPGVATGALYFIYDLYFLARFDLQGPHLVGLAIGAAGLLFNYLLAARKVQKWRERQRTEPATA